MITPTYSGCKDTFGRTVIIDNGTSGANLLTYTFTSGATKGQVDVSGEMTLTIQVAGSTVCTVIIKSPQTNNGITYHNLGGTNGVQVTTNTTNVKSVTEGGFINCGVTNGEHNEGTYTGTTVMRGVDTSGNPVAIAVD